MFSSFVKFSPPSEISINEKKYHILVNFSPKKSSSVTIKDDKIIFRLSSYLSTKQKNLHFEKLLEKITKKIQKLNISTSEKTISQILEDKSFLFAEDIYKIEFWDKKQVKLLSNIFYLNPNLPQTFLKNSIAKLLSKKYYQNLFEYLNYINKNSYNYDIKDFSLKSLSSKWGHCTYDNKILLNLKLLNTKKEILDYVIYHELAHIKIKNHSKEFWTEVARFCPNYKILRKTLKENPPGLFK